jgi:hypothetical protein
MENAGDIGQASFFVASPLPGHSHTSQLSSIASGKGIIGIYAFQ